MKSLIVPTAVLSMLAAATGFASATPYHGYLYCQVVAQNEAYRETFESGPTWMRAINVEQEKYAISPVATGLRPVLKVYAISSENSRELPKVIKKIVLKSLTTERKGSSEFFYGRDKHDETYFELSTRADGALGDAITLEEDFPIEVKCSTNAATR